MAQQTEVKKMKQGMSYSCKEKTIILNVFKYFRQIFPEKCVTEIVKRTAKATGCSEKSVFQFRKEEASAEGFKEPSKTKIRRNLNINSRFIKYDNNVRDTIRTIIYDLKCQNIVPSLNTILKNVNGNNNMPKFSLMTLRRLLFDMGFSYEKNGNKSILVEKPNDLKKNQPSQAKCVKKKQQIQPIQSQPLQNTSNIVNNQLMNENIKPVDQNHIKSVHIHHPHPEIGHRLLPMHIPHQENHLMPIHNSHPMPIRFNHHHQSDMMFGRDTRPLIHPHIPAHNIPIQQ